MESLDEQSSPGPSPDPEIFRCPGCGEDVQAERQEVAHLNACPYCSERMLIPALDGSTELPEESPVKADEGDELDGLRMRALSLSRRAAMRARTYCLLASVGCLYIAYLAGSHVYDIFVGKQPGSLMVIFWAIGLLVSLGYALNMFRRARAYERESREPLQKDPEAPPDFTPLSDGSQYTKNLEGMGHISRPRADQDERGPAGD